VSRARAVVFAYHDVGVRCLKALLSAEVAVPLVVTVRDDPAETRWFASVADTAAEYGLEVVAPADANTTELARRIADLQPDFLFSFYYRAMLAAPLEDSSSGCAVMYRMRVVTRACSMASIVSGKPGPVPGAGGNCPHAGADDRAAMPQAIKTSTAKRRE